MRGDGLVQQTRHMLGSERTSQGCTFGLKVVSGAQIRFVRSHPTKQGQLVRSQGARRPQHNAPTNGDWKATRPLAASRRSYLPVQSEQRPRQPCPGLVVRSPGKAFLPSHCSQSFHSAHPDESGGRGPPGHPKRLGRLACHLLPPHPTSLWGLRRQK